MQDVEGGEMKYITCVAIYISLAFSVAGAEISDASEVNNTIFAKLLSEHVGDGRVDYDGFKADEVKLDQYLEMLARVDPEKLTRSGRFAFYINLYNAWTIKLILSKYPNLESIKDLGSIFRSPWKKKIVKLNGRVVSLDYIEHGLLRPTYKDPRIHFAVNCASKSCPQLRNEPYAGETLELQLNDAARAFINDPESNYIDKDTLYVSRIFKWYHEDFRQGVVPFVKSYANGPLKEKIEAIEAHLQVAYLPYDWSLNDK